MQDNGHLLPSSPLTGNSSMSGGNTLSDQSGSMTAPGGLSEQMQGITVHTPVVEVQPAEGRRPVMEDGGHYAPQPAVWKEIP